MTNSPRPSEDRILRVIGFATLVDDQRVINCWEVWLGGFEIVARHDITDPAQVRAAAEWASRTTPPGPATTT